MRVKVIALAYLAEQLGRAVTTFGIELSPQRAEEARQRLDHVLNTAFENAVLTDETFSLVFTNPPYDGETATGGGERMEFTFLNASTKLLVRGGVLVYIIPEKRVSEKVAKHLAGWYENLRCFRFAGQDYDRFHQVVIFGTRRLVYHQPSNADVDAVQCLVAWAGPSPASRRRSARMANSDSFPSIRCSIRDIRPEMGTTSSRHLHCAARVGRPSASSSPRSAWRTTCRRPTGRPWRWRNTPAWLELIPETEPPAITPAITPKLGHVSMQVSGGLLGTNLVTGEDGRALLIKGGTEKFTVRVDSESEDAGMDYDPDDPQQRKKLFRIKVEERSRPVLYTLDEQGNLIFLNQPDADPGRAARARQQAGSPARSPQRAALRSQTPSPGSGN